MLLQMEMLCEVGSPGLEKRQKGSMACALGLLDHLQYSGELSGGYTAEGVTARRVWSGARRCPLYCCCMAPLTHVRWSTTQHNSARRWKKLARRLVACSGTHSTSGSCL